MGRSGNRVTRSADGLASGGLPIAMGEHRRHTHTNTGSANTHVAGFHALSSHKAVLLSSAIGELRKLGTER